MNMLPFVYIYSRRIITLMYMLKKKIIKKGVGVELGVAAILTVSIGVFSTGRLIPPGVSVGLKETERFPDTGVAVGTISLCTGGTEESTCIGKSKRKDESDPRRKLKAAPIPRCLFRAHLNFILRFHFPDNSSFLQTLHICK